MSYKLNKNLTTPILALFMMLNHASSTHAQGVVSLVDDSAGIEDDVFPDVTTDTIEQTQPKPTMDTTLPDTLSEEDVIPLDNGLLSPAEPVSAPKALEPKAPAEPKAADPSLLPEDEPDAAFSLGLPEEDLVGMPNPKDHMRPMRPGNPEELNARMAEAKARMAQKGNMPQRPEQPQSPATAQKQAAVPTAAPTAAPLQQSGDKFANSVLAKVDNDLFSQMSDIEKQTTLLTLELRREKLRSEIEAVKAQRDRAEQEKLLAEEEKKRQELERQKEQEAKVIREQVALKEKEIELEKLKQRKMLNSYMNQMLIQNQKWIDENAELYRQMRQVEDDRRKLAEDFKSKLEELTSESAKLAQIADTAKNNHDRTVASLTAQNVQLKKRIEADALAAKNREKNPFDEDGNPSVKTSVDGKLNQVVLSKEYAIMEIVGKGENLSARLINKDGESFMVNKGTMLNTGHMVDDITDRYIQFDKNGLKDYLYTANAATGSEPQKMEGMATPQANKPTQPVIIPNQPIKGTDQGIPSLGSGMFVK